MAAFHKSRSSNPLQRTFVHEEGFWEGSTSESLSSSRDYGTYYHYCAIDADTISSLLSAPSMGRFFNSEIKGRFDCRVNPVSSYPD